MLSGVVFLEPGGGGAVSAAELQQQWVGENDKTKTAKPTVPPLFSREVLQSEFETTPAYETIEADSVQGFDFAENDDEIRLAQRIRLNRVDTTAIRNTIKAVPNLVLPNTAPTMGGNANVIYSDWFDGARGRPVPVKIYYPINAHQPCPTILFSHGLGGSNENCAYLGEYWAANGYVSIFIHHFGSDDTVWKGKVRPLAELRAAYQTSWTGRSRVQDIQFVLSQLERQDTRNLPYSLIDMKRIGVAGYDLGAFASLLMAGQLPPEGHAAIYEPRIKAVLAMSPPVQANPEPITRVYGQIETPCLFITGTKDDGVVGTTQAGQRRIPYDSISCNDQYLVVFEGTDHMIYAGHPFPFIPRTKNDGPYQVSIARISTNFWNAYLKSDPEALAYMMSRNVTGLLDGLGRIERKFYLRERRDASSDDTPRPTENKGEPLPRVEPGNPSISNSDTPQYLTVPGSPYTENRSLPRAIRPNGSVPRRLPVKAP